MMGVENKEQKNFKKDYLSPKDIAEKLQLSHATVTKLMKVKGFPLIRVGRSIRVYEDELDKFMANYKTQKIDL